MKQGPIDTAKELLSGWLQDGPVAVIELERRAQKRNISRTSLQRARKALKIKAHGGYRGTPSTWSLQQHDGWDGNSVVGLYGILFDEQGEDAYQFHVVGRDEDGDYLIQYVYVWQDEEQWTYIRRMTKDELFDARKV